MDKEITYDYNNPEILKVLHAFGSKDGKETNKICYFIYNGAIYCYEWFSNGMIGTNTISDGNTVIYSAYNPKHNTDLGRYLDFCFMKQNVNFIEYNSKTQTNG